MIVRRVSGRVAPRNSTGSFRFAPEGSRGGPLDDPEVPDGDDDPAAVGVRDVVEA